MAYSCKYNPWVICKDRAGCPCCGWNPEEVRRRLERRKYPKKETAPDATNIEDGRPEGQT